MSHLFVVDGEMTGKRLTKHALIELGVIFLDLSNGQTIDKLDLIFNVPDGREWDPGIKNWMLQQPKLLKVVEAVESGKGLGIKEGMTQFVTFIKKHYDSVKGNVVIGADHLGIDSAWIDLYLSIADYDPLHVIFGTFRPTIDIHSFHQGCSRKTHRHAQEFTDSGKKFSANVAAYKYFNIKERPSTKHTHRAIDDAENTAQAHFKVLRAMESLNESYTPSSMLSPDRKSSSTFPPSTASYMYYFPDKHGYYNGANEID